MPFFLVGEHMWPRIYSDLGALDIEPLMARGDLKTSELMWGQHSEPISLRRVVVSYRPLRKSGTKVPDVPTDLGDWLAHRSWYATLSIRAPRSAPHWDSAIRSSIQAAELTIHDLRVPGHQPDILSLDDLKVAIRVMSAPAVTLTSQQVDHGIEALIERDILRPDFVTDAPVLDPERYMVVVYVREDGGLRDSLVLNPALREAIDSRRVDSGWGHPMEGLSDDSCYFHFSSLSPVLSLFLAFLEVRNAVAGPFSEEELRDFHRTRQRAVCQFLGLPSCEVCFRPRRSGRWKSRCQECRARFGGANLPSPFVAERRRRKVGSN